MNALLRLKKNWMKQNWKNPVSHVYTHWKLYMNFVVFRYFIERVY